MSSPGAPPGPPPGPRLGTAHGTVAPVRADPSGRTGPTRGQAARGWRRTSHGYYVPADAPTHPAQRVAEAGVLVPRGSAVTGWGALCWHGGRWFTGRGADGLLRPVDIVGRARIRRQPPISVREERLDDEDRLLVDGLRVATAAHAVCFCLRYTDSLSAAIEALAMAYLDDLVSPAEVLAWLEGHPGRTGIEQARQAWAQGDENMWSPQEVHLQRLWERVRGVRPLANRPVFDLAGNLLGTVDMLDPVGGVGAEYEGTVHLEATQRRRDLAKEQRLRDAGLEVFAVVAGDLRPRGDLPGRLAGAYERAARTPVAERRWTLESPRWWVPTLTVDQRRALSVTEREIWLPDRRTRPRQ